MSSSGFSIRKLPLSHCVPWECPKCQQETAAIQPIAKWRIEKLTSICLVDVAKPWRFPAWTAQVSDPDLAVAGTAALKNCPAPVGTKWKQENEKYRGAISTAVL